MPQFRKSTPISATPRTVFRTHFGRGALALLVPPWEDVRVLEAPEAPTDGTRAVLSVGFGPIRLRWIAEHEGFTDLGEAGGEFTDVQTKGPFKKWRHRHVVRPGENGGAILEDSIDYELPFGVLGRLFGGWMTRRKIEMMFEFRHQRTRAAAEEKDADR